MVLSMWSALLLMLLIWASIKFGASVVGAIIQSKQRNASALDIRDKVDLDKDVMIAITPCVEGHTHVTITFRPGLRLKNMSRTFSTHAEALKGVAALYGEWQYNKDNKERQVKALAALSGAESAQQTKESE